MAKSNSICSIPDCGKKALTKGFCANHYYRLRRYGDPLGGGTSHGEPLRFIHEVALKHEGDECLPWPFSKSGAGRGQIWVGDVKHVTPRYVCELIHGAPPTPEHEAAHSCGKGHEGCISPHHLSWKTTSENHADKLIHGTHLRGERSGTAKLTEDQAREILRLKGVKSQYELAKQFGVRQPSISRIHQGKRWAHL